MPIHNPGIRPHCRWLIGTDASQHVANPDPENSDLHNNARCGAEPAGNHLGIVLLKRYGRQHRMNLRSRITDIRQPVRSSNRNVATAVLSRY